MGDIDWSDAQLKAAGVPKRKLKSLVRKLGECAEMMQELGFTLYGSDGSGYLIHNSRPEHVDGKADFGAIVSHVGFGFDGGGW